MYPASDAGGGAGQAGHGAGGKSHWRGWATFGQNDRDLLFPQGCGVALHALLLGESLK